MKVPKGELKVLDLYNDGSKVIERRIVFDRPLNRNTVQAMVNRISEKAKHEVTGTMIVATNTDYAWRSGRSTAIGERPDIFNINNYYAVDEESMKDKMDAMNDQIKAVSVFYILPKAGGCSGKFNDCLFHCIENAVGGRDKLLRAAKPSLLKKHLGLERSERVGVEHIEALEKLYGMAINVTGDAVYTSTVPKPRWTANIALSKGHFKSANASERVKQLLRGAMYDRKKDLQLALFRGVTVDRRKLYVEIYDGESVTKGMWSEFTAHRWGIVRDYQQRGFALIEARGNKPIEAEYQELVNGAVALKERTKGALNMQAVAWSLKALVLKQFYEMSQGMPTPETIEQDEALWLYNANCGGLIFCDTGSHENAKCYDVNSNYPKALRSINFPMKRGEFKKLKCIPEHPRPGIYRARIKWSGDKKKDRMLKTSKTDYITQYDVVRARELGLEVELYDTSPNAMIYAKDAMVRGYDLFGPIVDYLYELKKEGFAIAKAMTKMLGGALCQIKRRTTFTDGSDDLGTRQILSIVPHDESQYLVEDYEPSEFFKTDYARVGPFMTAYSRAKLSRAIEPFADKVVRVHTDSFTVVGDVDLPDDIVLGDGIGEWKLEHSGCVMIGSNIHVSWL